MEQKNGKYRKEEAGIVVVGHAGLSWCWKKEKKKSKVSATVIDDLMVV